MKTRILPSPDIYASCPYDGEVLRYYAGIFPSVYILLSPFMRAVSTFHRLFQSATDLDRTAIANHYTPARWEDIAKRSGLADIAAVDIALRTQIQGLRAEFMNDDDADRLQRCCEIERILPPTEGEHSPLLHKTVLELFQELGHDWVWVGDEGCTERKLYWIDDLKAGLYDPITGHCNVFAPDKSLLWTVHWDSHFSFLCASSEAALKSVGVEEKLEGFFCNPETEVYWSLQSIQRSTD
jgi:hypothetical protein